MTSFKFPPPPPPPPPASTSSDTQNTYSSQRGGYSRGRGDRGRGRGAPGRGRGNFQGNTRGGYVQSDRSGNTLFRGDPRGGCQQRQPRIGGLQSQNIGNASSSYQCQQPAPLAAPVPQIPSPSGAFGNPTFSSPALSGAQVPQIDPNTLVQAMSFMTTPAGMQSMAAFANHMAGVNAGPQHSQPHIPQPFPLQMHNSPPSIGINKRKRGERQMQFETQQKPHPVQTPQQPSTKPPRAKCKAAPEIPSFGFTLPPTPIPRPSASSKLNPNRYQKKPRINLGLAHREEVNESSDEEDVDEEAAFVANYKVEGIMFEYNGESISLQTQAEVAAWIKDRRRRFPTQKRIAQKTEEAAAKRASELEFLRKLKGKPTERKIGVQQASFSKPAQAKKSPAKPKADLEGMRRKVQESIAKKKKEVPLEPQAKHKALDLGLGYASDTVSDSDDSSELSDSSVVSSSSESSADSGSDANDSDAPPAAQSSKVPIAPVVVPPPPPAPVLPQPKQKKIDICPNWKRNGKCKYAQYCKYPHPKEGKANRVGLYEKMVEQELEKADRLALDAIKFLGRNGYLG